MVAYRRGVLKLYVDWMIKNPIPVIDPIHSAMIAPITEDAAAIFREEKRKGSEAKTRNFQKVSGLEAERTRKSSRDSLLTDSNPRTMLTKVGKNETNAAMAILGA